MFSLWLLVSWAFLVRHGRGLSMQQMDLPPLPHGYGAPGLPLGPPLVRNHPMLGSRGPSALSLMFVLLS